MTRRLCERYHQRHPRFDTTMVCALTLGAPFVRGLTFLGSLDLELIR